MALNAKFTADFTSFYAAVQKAEGHLKGFEADADKTGKALDRMVDQLSGRKVVEQATLMSKAIQEIGDVSLLTDAQLRKIAPTVAEASEQLQRMGKAVPADFQAITKAAEGANQATGDWKSALLSTAGALGVAFSVNTIKNFVVGVIDAASEIGDLSEKLGISAEAVQRFQYAADQSGASIDTVDRAIKAMNVNLAEGNKSTVASLTAVGLRFEDIRRMSPERAFAAIGDAVAGIEDPMQRAQVATELFGTAGQELIPTFLAGLTKIGNQTDVMADDTVERLKAAQDAWSKFTNAVTVYSGEAIGAIGRFGSAWQSNSKLLAEAANPFVAIPKAIKDLDLTANAAAQSASDLGAMVATLPAPTLAFADALKPVGMNAEQVAATIGYMNANLEDNSAALARATAAEREATKSREAYAAMAKVGAGAEFAWQNALGLTKFKADQLAVSETQLVEATETLATFVARHQGEMFPEPPEGSLEKWKAGEQAILKIVPATDTLRSNLGLLSQSFANLGAIGGKGLSEITRGLGSVVGGLDVAMKSTDSFKSGFSSLGKGNMLSGISSITSGIAGIVGVATMAIQAVKALWSWAKGGEEGQTVNPNRDAWFGGRGVQDIGDQLAPYMSGESARKMIESVFNAKTQADFSKASGDIDRILAGGNTFAAGSGGFRDFGSGTLAMLHGKEAIVPASAVSGAGMGASVVIQINAQGAFFDTPGDLQRLADKVNDALTAKYGLTNRLRAA